MISRAYTRILWREVYPKLSEGRPGLFGAVTARAEAQTMRLACLYAFLDLSPAIRIEHLHAAIAIWTYCEESAKYIFGNYLGDPVADSIKQALDEIPSGLTRTEISSYILKRNVEASRINEALNKLFASGFAYKEKEEVESGRPTVRWFSIKYQKN